jgi:Tfp pilus assembly protein PilO
VTLTTPMKIVLAVIIIAVIGLGFWLLDWQKKQAELATIQRTLEEKKAEKDRIEKDVQKIDELVKINNDLKGQLKVIIESGFVPEQEKDFVPNYLEKVEGLVARVAAENGDDSFEILSVTPGAQTIQQAPASAGGTKTDAKTDAKAAAAAPAPPPEALKNYPTRTFQMSMRGRYETLIDFLDRLGRLELQRLVTVNKLALSPAEGVKSGSPTLAITMPLTAYLRTGGDSH